MSMILSPYDIARVCHEANRALQIALDDPAIPVADSWEATRADVQASAISGVSAILENPSLTPEESHEGWVDFKLDQGWKFGPVKDEDAKTHPLLVPYDDLAATDKVKDALFGAIVRALKPLLSGEDEVS